MASLFAVLKSTSPPALADSAGGCTGPGNWPWTGAAGDIKTNDATRISPGNGKKGKCFLLIIGTLRKVVDGGPASSR